MSSQIPHCILLRSRIGSILPDPVFWFSSRLIMLLYNMRYWGHSGGFRGANLSARQERGGKEKNNACRQVIVLSLRNVHLANAGFYWLRERQYFSIFPPLSCLTPRTGGLKPA